MELQPGSKQKAVEELLTQLLSPDAVVSNSVINSTFAPNVTYSGHTLRFRGASNLKHFTWFFNEILTSGPASFDTKDIEWDEQTNTATIPTTRYVRPRLFPLVGFAVPVETHLRFSPDGGNAGKGSSSSQKMYVTSYEDRWVGDQIVGIFPVITALYTALVTPIVTILVLTLSNILFAGNARLSSSKRQYIDGGVDALNSRAKKALPADVTKNVGSGYQKGEKLAQGWGTYIVNILDKTTYPVLSSLEFASQRGVSALPLPLPYPYIYDAHSHPPQSKKKGDEKKKIGAEKKESAPAKDDKPFVSSTSGSAPSQDKKTADVKKATVQVTPSLDGGDQGKTVEISSRMNNESKEEPARAAEPKLDTSLYAQLKKDGELPGQQDNLALPSNTAQAGVSSEEEESSTHGGATNGAPKKKSKSSKKKKAGVSHPPPPSFQESLHQVEEHEQQAHH